MALPTDTCASLPAADIARLWTLEEEGKRELRNLLGETRYEQVLGTQHILERLSGGQILYQIAKAMEGFEDLSPLSQKRQTSFRSNAFFQTMENVDYYTRVCRSKGVPDTHLFSPSDLSNPKEFRHILTSIIFAIRWIAQPSGPRGKPHVPIVKISKKSSHPRVSEPVPTLSILSSTSSSSSSSSTSSSTPSSSTSSSTSSSNTSSSTSRPSTISSSPSSSSSSPPSQNEPISLQQTPESSAVASDISTIAVTGSTTTSPEESIELEPPAAEAAPDSASTAAAELAASTPPRPALEQPVRAEVPTDSAKVDAAPQAEVVDGEQTDLDMEASRPPSEVSMERAVEIALRVANQAAEGILDETDLAEPDEILAPNRSSKKRHSSSRKKKSSTRKSRKGKSRDDESSPSTPAASTASAPEKTETTTTTTTTASSSSPSSSLPSSTASSSTSSSSVSSSSRSGRKRPKKSTSSKKKRATTETPAVSEGTHVPEPTPSSSAQTLTPTSTEVSPPSPDPSSSSSSSSSSPSPDPLPSPSPDPSPSPSPSSSSSPPSTSTSLKSILRVPGTKKGSPNTVKWDQLPPPIERTQHVKKFETARNQFIEKWLSSTSASDREKRRAETYQRATARAQKSGGLVSGRAGAAAREKVWDSDSDSSSSDQSSSDSE